MTVVRVIFKNFTAFLMSILLSVIPFKGFELPILETARDNCLLSVGLLSDVHIEEKEPFRALFLRQGLRGFSRAKSPVDAVAICGDLTNYADEPALARYYSILSDFADMSVISAPGNHDIGHAGDRGVTNISRAQAMQNFIRYQNNYAGTQNDTVYYAQEVNGFLFIVLGDEVLDGGHWDAVTMSPEQLSFLDRSLAEGTKDGKPVFVLCHWPIQNTNGEPIIWPGCGIDTAEYDIPSILEKYKNVFYISGHMHAGIKSTAVESKYGLSSAETVNGVTYITLPSYGLVNMFGLPWSGTGAQLEVYADEVLFRPRNCLTGTWYTNAAYRFEITQ